MKITGNGRNADEIELNLTSMNTRFKCFKEPFKYEPQSDLTEPNVVVITFEDSREIDYLITMLEKFRARNVGYIGYWK